MKTKRRSSCSEQGNGRGIVLAMAVISAMALFPGGAQAGAIPMPSLYPETSQTACLRRFELEALPVLPSGHSGSTVAVQRPAPAARNPFIAERRRMFS
jgi:hypothetical protein